MDSYEYTCRITKDFEVQREISSYPSDAYGARRRFEEPKLSDFGLDPAVYKKCQRDYKEKADSRSKSGIFVLVTIAIIGTAIGGFFGAILGLIFGGFIAASLFPDPKQPPALINAHKYDHAIDEYKKAVECRTRIIREREENMRRKAEEERRLKERLERQKEEDYWLELSPFEFEEEVALRLKQSGMVDEAKVTKKSGDAGIDIWAKKNGRDIIIQCKAYTAPVGIKEARELLGVKIHENVKRAILVSRSTFTQSVSTFAQENGLDLMSLSDLVQLAGNRSFFEHKGYPSEKPNAGVSNKLQQIDPVLKAVSEVDARLVDWRPKTKADSAPVSAAQIEFLERHGFDATGWKAGYAERVMDIVAERREQGLASPKQVRCLMKHGHPDAHRLKFEEAAGIMDALTAKTSKTNRKNVRPDDDTSFPFVTRSCAAINKSGTRCGLLALNGSKYCHIHDSAKSKNPAELKKMTAPLNTKHKEEKCGPKGKENLLVAQSPVRTEKKSTYDAEHIKTARSAYNTLLNELAKQKRSD